MTLGPPEGKPLEETPGRVDIALAVPVRDDRVLVSRRAEGLHLAGFWDVRGVDMLLDGVAAESETTMIGLQLGYNW